MSFLGLLRQEFSDLAVGLGLRDVGLLDGFLVGLRIGQRRQAPLDQSVDVEANTPSGQARIDGSFRGDAYYVTNGAATPPATVSLNPSSISRVITRSRPTAWRITSGRAVGGTSPSICKAAPRICSRPTFIRRRA